MVVCTFNQLQGGKTGGVLVGGGSGPCIKTVYFILSRVLLRNPSQTYTIFARILTLDDRYLVVCGLRLKKKHLIA